MEDVSVALLADQLHFVSGDKTGKIRYWRVEDGEEVGAPINVGSAVRCIATSRDRIVAGTASHKLFVWDAKTRKEFCQFTHRNTHSVDISSDGTKVVIIGDRAVKVLSLPDGEKLWYNWYTGLTERCRTANFSPDGLFIALGLSFLSVFNSQDGKSIAEFQVFQAVSVAWTSDSKQLFALTFGGNISCVDMYSQATLSTWPIHSRDRPTCISLSTDGLFVVASASTSVSFWDTRTNEQIGSIIRHPGSVRYLAVSQNYDLVMARSSNIALCDIRNVRFDVDDHVGGSSFDLRPVNLHS